MHVPLQTNKQFTGWSVAGLMGCCLVSYAFLIVVPFHQRLEHLFEADFFSHPEYLNYWPAVLAKSRNLLSNLPCPDYAGCHEGKLAFRLVLPILTNLLGSPRLVYYAQLGLLFVFLGVSIRETLLITKSWTTTFWFVLGFTTLYAAYAFVYEFRGQGDAFA